jgi:hypothetical protein
MSLALTVLNMASRPNRQLELQCRAVKHAEFALPSA